MICYCNQQQLFQYGGASAINSQKLRYCQEFRATAETENENNGNNIKFREPVIDQIAVECRISKGGTDQVSLYYYTYFDGQRTGGICLIFNTAAVRLFDTSLVIYAQQSTNAKQTSLFIESDLNYYIEILIHAIQCLLSIFVQKVRACFIFVYLPFRSQIVLASFKKASENLACAAKRCK